MKVKVLFFGELSEQFGKERYVSENNVYELMNTLALEWPAFGEKQVTVAVNAQVVHENRIFMEGDVVAVMPPFSGG